MKKIFIGSGSGSEHKICSYQSTLVYAFFKDNGYELLKSPINADFILINGYPFEELEEKTNLLTIGYYLKKFPKSEIILFGSIPGMMRDLKGIDRISLIGWNEMDRFNKMFEHNISIENINFDVLRFFVPLKIESLSLNSFGYEELNTETQYKFSEDDLNISHENIREGNFNIDKIEAYDYDVYNYLEDKSGEYPIITCKGCGGNCTYCDIRNIAGFVKSIPLDKIILRIKRGLSLGYKTFHFLDEDTSSYGLDIGINISSLLNEISKIEGDFSLRIFYFEPGKLEKFFEKIDKNIWNKINHLCIPIQSSSQRLLKLMNRHYNIENVINIIKKIRLFNCNINITTQFMYGFPSESFDEFKSYFKLIPLFDWIDFYYYSDRKGTKSSLLEGKISRDEMKRRLIFLWKIKKQYENKIADKNESLEQGINIFNQRNN